MAAMGYLNMFLGIVLLLAPVVFCGVRCGLFNGFAWKKFWCAIDRGILFQGGLAILTWFPLWLAGIAAMGDHEFHPALNVLVMTLFSFQVIFWQCYVPTVVVTWLIRFVAKRITKRSEKVS
jgi:hypothetical protein